MNYIALLHKEENSDYGVSFPDFPGCITAGESLDEAKTLAQEALLDHIELLKERETSIPAPSSLDIVMADSENHDAVAFLVEIPSQKAVRVNITIPEDTLALIDRFAYTHHLSRSAFLTAAALEYGKSDNRKKGGA